MPVLVQPSPATSSATSLSPGLRVTLTGAAGTMTGAGLGPFATTVRPQNQYGPVDPAEPVGVALAGVRGGLDGGSAAGLDSYTPQGIDGD